MAPFRAERIGADVPLTDPERDHPSAVVPRTLQGSVSWLATRALNVQRRPVMLGVVAVVVFVGSLAGLLAIPHSAARAARLIAPQPHERPDTVPLVAAAREAERRVAGLEEALGSARALIERWASLPPPAAETLSTADRVRRDSLARIASGLEQLRERVEAAPLLASYRALAESPELRGRARVRQLLDSLTEIERAREQVGGVGGVDPVFVALTERAGEIGREIRSIAESRLAVLRRDIEGLRPPPAPDPPPPPRVDTLGLVAQLDTARIEAQSVFRTLNLARARHRELDDRAARARAIASIGASPFAIFAAALLLGLGAAFGAAFVAELRSPRVGNGRELEWLAGAPLLTVIRDGDSVPERSRRATDQLLPPLLQHSPDAYREMYARAADRAHNLAPTTVMADEADVAAAVAANLAAASAQTARATVLLDLDGDGNALAAALGISVSPGLSELLRRTASWIAAASTVVVGRDRVLDVIPAGAALTGEQMSELKEAFSGAVEHFSRRYDTLIVSAPAQVDGSPPPFTASVPQAIVCARSGRTPVRMLLRMVNGLREQGVIVRGVVLWDAEEPEPADQPLAAEQPLAAAVAD